MGFCRGRSDSQPLTGLVGREWGACWIFISSAERSSFDRGRRFQLILVGKVMSSRMIVRTCSSLARPPRERVAFARAWPLHEGSLSGFVEDAMTGPSTRAWTMAHRMCVLAGTELPIAIRLPPPFRLIACRSGPRLAGHAGQGWQGLKKNSKVASVLPAG